MKILFVIDQVYLHGGIERVLSIKANYLSNDSNNEIHIVTSEQKNNKACYFFNPKITFHDIAINYNRVKSYFHPENLLKLPKHISKTKKIIKSINPDILIVCSHSTDTYFMPFICKKVPKVKEFHYSKSIEVEKKKKSKSFFKKMYFKFTHYVEKKYDKLVILNKDESKYYKSNNTIVIPNPLTFFPDKVSNLENKIAIAAGRIAFVKGYDILIDIWKLISKDYPDWKLNIYGNGDANYTKKLADKIKSHNIENSVELCGPTNNISEKMIESSLYLMTSHNECFPLVLLEAQSCGLPIISFDCPNGPRNIVDKNNGILVEPYNNEEFANQLKTLFDNPKKRKELGSNARKNSNNFSENKVMTMWLNMFNDLID